MPSESFPCIICGGNLYREIDEYEAQPRGGVMCSTSGNYGSTVFDPMSGESCYFNICDDCFAAAGEQGRVFISQDAIRVTTDVRIFEDRMGPSIVGWKRVERPFVPWHRGLEPSDEREHLTAREILDRLDSDRYKFNLGRENYEAMAKDQDA